MSYLALYRKYRPTTFEEVIGQEHITKTLQNQIENNRIGHAYLFCGTRGTGKTSCAKIFAKAINCEQPVHGSPCLKCRTCTELANQNNIDILEIDAASNNRVDEIREIREKVKYTPVIGKYKVYIIDEVHMLTESAFNALLKTLEEPPAHVVFILATTEPQKLPATILSRCMRFDFKMVDETEIACLIEKVFKSSNIEADNESIKLIARAGEGSVRDALSIADMCASFCNNNITFEKANQVIGGSSKETLKKLTEHIVNKNVGEFISLLSSVLSAGTSVQVLNKDLCAFLRDLIVIKTCEQANTLLGLPKDVFEDMKTLADSCESNKLLSVLTKLSAIDSDLKFATNPRMIFETTCLDAIITDVSYNSEEINERFNLLEKKIEDILKNE